jgi:medium-chain acyl-[acyl-carrier-protein] hydrolase
MNSWIACPKINPRAKVRLYCFPYSGASASIYYPWIEILPPSIEVFPVQLPGRGYRVSEAPFEEITCLIQVLDKEILNSLTEKPFALFGHSMGALVAYELSKQLEKNHQLSPLILFVSGHNAPHIPDRADPIHHLEESDFLDRIRKLNGTPEEILRDKELVDLLLPILRADFKLSETYEWELGKMLSCPIIACGGLQDEYLDKNGLDAWGDLTEHGSSIRFFPGDHFYLNQNRHSLLQVIAQELNKVIDLNS